MYIMNVFFAGIILSLFSLANAAGGVVPVCPAKCPSCTKCDPKKGTCTLPRDFVTCTKGVLPGYCYAGVCNAKMTLSPVVATLGKCQEYDCNINSTCILKLKPDGTDCSTVGLPGIFVRSAGACVQPILGLSALGIFPLRNIGCVGLPNGTPCDTNDLNDGETCVAGVCKFPDGSYYGYQIGQVF